MDKLHPDKVTSSSYDLLHFKKRVPLDKPFFIGIYFTSNNSSTIVKDIYFESSPMIYGENHSLYRLPNTFLLSTEYKPYEDRIFPHDTNNAESLRLYECFRDIPSPDSMKLGHYSSVTDTTSSFVLRINSYLRLCGSSFYDVSKYFYDD